MRLSVSNLAWDVVEDAAVARVLGEYDVRAIDIAPGKYFPNPLIATPDDIARAQRFWADRGVAIHALQALLFGADHLNIFGPPAVQNAVLARLDAICAIAAGLGAGVIVFGSRANRDRADLDDAAAFESAVAFFRRAAALAANWGLVMTLEAIPASYGSNFMTRTGEAAAVVAAVDADALRLHLDTGAMFVNGENPARIIAQYASLIAHVHASDPGLGVLGDAGCDHASVAAALMRLCPELTITIEMLPNENADHMDSLRRALTYATQFYGSRQTPLS